MIKFTFAKWIKTNESFNSLTHYKDWLNGLSKEESKKTNLYYKEKYLYFVNYLQTEWD